MHRLPLIRLTTWLVLLFWLSVTSQSELRQLTQSQLRRTFESPSSPYTYASLDETDIPGSPSNRKSSHRIVRAVIGREKARPLLNQYPDDIPLLAAYVLNNQAYYGTKHKGPLLSPYPNWSVQIKDAPIVSLSVPSLPSSQQTSDSSHTEAINDLLRLIARGQKLEPQNTFWDWMQMSALIAAKRESEIPMVLKRARYKTIWNDHILEQIRANNELLEHEAYISPGTKLISLFAASLPHLSRVRTVSQMVAQLVMGLRLQKRKSEALLVANDAIHLLRIMRLQSSNEISSLSASSCESIVFVQTLPPLGARPNIKGSTPASTVAQLPSTLLFLAHRISPRTAHELDGEWANLHAWRTGLNSPPRDEALGGLVRRQTVEGAGWTARATSYLFDTLPVTLLVWLILSLIVMYLRSRYAIEIKPQILWWGAIFGLGLLSFLLAFEWVKRAVSIKETADCFASGGMCDVGTVIPEEIFFPQGSLLSLASPLWGIIALWLGMLAFILAFRKSKAKPTFGTVREHEVLHPLDWVWGSVKWMWRNSGKLLSTFSPLWVFGAAVAILFWPAASAEFFWSPLNLLALTLALCVWPLAVTIRQVAIFSRTRQRTMAPLRFLVFWRSLLGGYVLATLLILPVLLFVQGRFERDFNREFAPIERGQMVRVMQQKRGLPIR